MRAFVGYHAHGRDLAGRAAGDLRRVARRRRSRVGGRVIEGAAPGWKEREGLLVHMRGAALMSASRAGSGDTTSSIAYVSGATARTLQGILSSRRLQHRSALSSSRTHPNLPAPLSEILAVPPDSHNIATSALSTKAGRPHRPRGCSPARAALRVLRRHTQC